MDNVYIFYDKYGMVLGVCTQEHLNKFLLRFPIGIHDNETNKIIIYRLNDLNDVGVFYDPYENK